MGRSGSQGQSLFFSGMLCIVEYASRDAIESRSEFSLAVHLVSLLRHARVMISPLKHIQGQSMMSV